MRIKPVILFSCTLCPRTL